MSVQLLDKDTLVIWQYILDSLGEFIVNCNFEEAASDESNLLNYTAAIHLKGKWEHMTFHGIGENSLLDLRAMLEQFLNNLIPYVSDGKPS
jgi:hypothetical protein